MGVLIHLSVLSMIALSLKLTSTSATGTPKSHSQELFGKVLSQPAENIPSIPSNYQHEKIRASERPKTLRNNDHPEKRKENDTVKEHGNLDSFGRDILSKIVETTSNIERKIMFRFLNIALGLNLSKTFLGDTVEKFKKPVKAIYPALVGKVLPQPAENISSTSSNGQHKQITTSERPKNETLRNTDHPEKRKENDTVKEHGILDFFGRDILSKIVGTTSDIERKIMLRFPNTTLGLDLSNSFLGVTVEKFKMAVKAIYPGTAWCGDGHKAKTDDDLGFFKGTDACCRDHDHCPDSIPANSEKYGLENTGLFTRSNCECDTKFYKCLKAANDMISKQIGYTYFTILGPQCFKLERLTIGCIKRERRQCIKYKYHNSNAKAYQWFDNPTF